MEILETPRLLLRKLSYEEYKDLFETFTQEDAMAVFGFDEEALFLAEKKKYEGGMVTYRTSFLYFFITEKSTSRAIGDCCYHTWYVPHSRAEIGYGIRREEDKNKGYMKEAILPILRYGFETMNLNRIEALISPTNIPSRKLVTGMGFTEEGTLREHYCKNGQLEDSVVYGLLRKEFTL